jgi:hypothetical protein
MRKTTINPAVVLLRRTRVPGATPDALVPCE